MNTDGRQVAKRKLLEFYKWLAVAGGCYRDLSFSTDWFVSLKRFNPWDGWKDWRQHAPNEVKAVVNTVNSMPNERLRAIICLCFLYPRELKPSEIMELLGLKKSQYYRERDRSLIEFYRCYLRAK